MPRKVGSETKKNVWNVTINIEDNEIHNKEYPTLNHIAKDLGLTYNQVYELGPNGRVKKRPTKNFRYDPKIQITRIAFNTTETPDDIVDID